MSEMRVAHGDAQAVFNQIDDALAQARQGLQAMQDTATQMTSGPWLGVASQKFGGNFQQIHDDLQAQHAQLTQLAEHGRYAVNAHVNQDAEV